MDPKQIVRVGYDAASWAYRGDTSDPDSADHQRCAAWIGELLAVLPPGAPVLDLGCGNGLPAGRLLTEAGCALTGVDISPVQLARARGLVPQATLICADMTTLTLPSAHFAAVVSLYAIIHVPLAEQPALLGRIFGWLRPGGYLLAVVGAEAWSGSEENWLGVPGATMVWSHADAATYQRWLGEAGFAVCWTRFVPEGTGGHTLLLAQRSG